MEQPPAPCTHPPKPDIYDLIIENRMPLRGGIIDGFDVEVGDALVYTVHIYLNPWERRSIENRGQGPELRIRTGLTLRYLEFLCRAPLAPTPRWCEPDPPTLRFQDDRPKAVEGRKGGAFLMRWSPDDPWIGGKSAPAYSTGKSRPILDDDFFNEEETMA